jgi:hypothetical protein
LLLDVDNQALASPIVGGGDIAGPHIGFERGETSPDIVKGWSFLYEGCDITSKLILADR